ncbi:MAG: PAS domain S-box protein [Ferruginibacter sp.]
MTQPATYPEHLSLSEKKFRNTVRQAPVGIAILKGRDFIIEMANDAYLAFVDKEEIAITGKPLFVVLPEVEAIVHPLLTGVLDTGIPYHATDLMVILNRHGKNEEAWFNLVYQPYFEDDLITGIIVVATEVTASVKAKHALAESERQFRNLVMQSPIPMTIFRGPDHVIEIANTEMINNIWRKTEAEVIGKKALEVFPELKKQKYPELLQEVLSTGKTHSEKESLAYVQGNDSLKKFYLDYEYAPLFETDGSVSGVMITVNDVTGQVEAREKLKENEEKLRVAIEAASLGTFDINLSTEAIDYSDRYLEIYGFRPDEKPTRQEVIDRLYPEDKITRARCFEEALKTGMLEYEAKVILPDNAFRWIRVKGKIIHDNDGKPGRVLGTVMDITKEKSTLQLIEESEVRLRLATEATNLATWDLDLDTRDIFYSPRLAEIFGYDKSKTLTHEYLRKHVHPDDIKTVETAFEKAMQTGIYDYESRITRPDKTICWIKTRGRVLFDEHRKPSRMIGTIADITESKINEEKLAKLASIVQSSEDAIISKRLDGIITSWNDSAERIFGYPANEMIGFSILKIIPEDRLQEEQQIISKLKNRERIKHFETKRLRKDKTLIDISLTVSPIYDTQGKVIGASKIARDVTAQKQIERIIAENEHRLNIAVEAAGLGTWELNFITKDVTYSRRYLDILGIDPQSNPDHEALMRNIHPEDLPIRNAAINEALRTGNLDVEMRLLTGKNKKLKWVTARGKVFYDGDNKPFKMLGTLMDITEEKLKKDVLQNSEERFRLLANSMPQLVWTAGAEGNVNYYNQSFYDYTGFTEGELDDDRWVQIIHPDDAAENVKAWQHAVSTGHDYLFEHRFRKKNGDYRWQLSRAIPLRDNEDNIQLWVGTSTDIHEIKESDQQKDLFISMASHELKTPITSIKGYVQLLMTMYKNSKDNFLTNSLASVNKQVSTLTNLISDLLDLSKIKSGSLQLNKEDFSMNNMIVDVINDIRKTEPGHSIVFTAGTDCMLHADKERIGQVLINFLTNAVKYSPGTDIINVSTSVKNNHAIVSVADKGIGISKTDQEKIFERFYRVEGRNEKTFPGFGIGLFICAEIIKRHEGKIEVESEPGKGSLFSFLLPLTKNNEL